MCPQMAWVEAHIFTLVAVADNCNSSFIDCCATVIGSSVPDDNGDWLVRTWRQWWLARPYLTTTMIGSSVPDDSGDWLVRTWRQRWLVRPYLTATVIGSTVPDRVRSFKTAWRHPCPVSIAVTMSPLFCFYLVTVLPPFDKCVCL